MIFYTRLRVAQYLVNAFSPILSETNSAKDIIYQPVDTALKYRLDQQDDNQYDFPFMSMYHTSDLPSLNDERYNHVVASQDGVEIDIGGGTFQIKMVPTNISYEVNFWEEQDLLNAETFVRMWNTHVRDETTDTFTYPFLDSNNSETADSLDFRTYMSFDDLTDNSAIERRAENGVWFRFTGTINLESVMVYDPEKPGAYPKIQKILVDFLQQEEDVDDILLEEMTIT